MRCRSCGGTKLYDVLDLGEQYLSDFVDKKTEVEKFPLRLVLCQDCDLVQLKDTTPPDKLYNSHYGYYSGINNTIKADLLNIVESAIERCSLTQSDIVLDIGSNDATLLKFYPQDLRRVGFDPVGKFEKYYDQENLTFINNYFNYENFKERFGDEKAKVITVISCFYDMEDPNTFCEDIQKALHPEGLLIIQQNYLGGMIQQNAFDNIVHEHLEYYSLTSLTRLLNRHGLDVVDVEVSDINGGSFRTYIKHMNNVKRMRINEQRMKLNNKNTYFLFALKVSHAVKRLHQFVKEESEKGKTIYLYGASTRGNTLIQAANLDNKMIKYAVERNPDKFGKRIASLDIPIISEEEARKDKPDYMLVLPWFFAEEFKEREREYLKAGGKLIIPLPEFKVISYEDINSDPQREVKPA